MLGERWGEKRTVELGEDDDNPLSPKSKGGSFCGAAPNDDLRCLWTQQPSLLPEALRVEAGSCAFCTTDSVGSTAENKQKPFFAFAFASSESFHRRISEDLLQEASHSVTVRFLNFSGAALESNFNYAKPEP
jgi:hypothetical protein